MAILPTTKTNENLCLELLRAETEDEIINILKKYEYWGSEHWRPYGDNENNWSTIGNQQGNPVSAMVEKMVNSIDAVLMRECYLSGLLPEDQNAPQSIVEAMERFFNVPKGNLANVTSTQRKELSQNIGFVATGRRQSPNYTVFDLGEGQTPRDMPDTLLSLSRSNKLRIPFVQGKFNMGGTGVIPFCGENNFQLIISRKHPKIARLYNSNDPTRNYWGFTIVRREPPSEGRRSSMITYLSPNESILHFEAECVALPQYRDESPLPSLKWGTIIKMFEYEMTGYKTHINLDLYNRISLTLPKPGLPIRFYERRGYDSHTSEQTMAGLHVRLTDDRNQNIEENFPTSHELRVQGEPMTATVYVFRKGKDDNYRDKEGVIFQVNGQAHGFIGTRIFSSKRVNLSYLADSILVMVDASNISSRSREDLFLNSRDRLRRGELYTNIEDNLEILLREHRGLRELQERRRREAALQKLSDAKPFKEILNKILRKSPSLSALFIVGRDLNNPYRTQEAGIAEEFKGKRFPTFFKIIPKDVERAAHLGQRFRVQFTTDAEDEFFDRDYDPGKLELLLHDKLVDNYVVNLAQGTATLNVELPKDATVDQELHYIVRVESAGDTFEEEFIRRVAPEISNHQGISGQRRPPAGGNGNENQLPQQLQLPECKEIFEADWPQYKFDRYSALRVIRNGEGSYDFFVNMDNIYFRADQKSRPVNEDPKLSEAKYKYGIVLIGLALLNEYKDKAKEDLDDEYPVEDYVFDVTKQLAPILLPMMDTLGTLSLDDLTESGNSDE